MKTLKILVCFFFVACQSKANLNCYKSVIDDGVKKVDFAKSSGKCFKRENVDHFITHFGFTNPQERQWQTTIYLHSRYVLRIWQPVEIDYTNCSIIGVVGRPNGVIQELSSVSRNKSGMISTIYKGQTDLSPEMIEKLIKNDFDFESIQVTLEEAQPIKGFSQFRKEWGKDIR